MISNPSLPMPLLSPEIRDDSHITSLFQDIPLILWWIYLDERDSFSYVSYHQAFCLLEVFSYVSSIAFQTTSFTCSPRRCFRVVQLCRPHVAYEFTIIAMNFRRFTCKDTTNDQDALADEKAYVKIIAAVQMNTSQIICMDFRMLMMWPRMRDAVYRCYSRFMAGIYCRS